MPKVITNRDNKQDKNLSGWDKAIADAHKQIRRLTLAVEHFQDMKKKGEPWPDADAPMQS
jgi:hypothetical protein